MFAIPGHQIVRFQEGKVIRINRSSSQKVDSIGNSMMEGRGRWGQCYQATSDKYSPMECPPTHGGHSSHANDCVRRGGEPHLGAAI